MENRDLFTMRELGDRDLEQFNSLLKYAFQVTSDEMLKTGWQEDEMKYSKAPMLKTPLCWDGSTGKTWPPRL